jgi:hypothetical protein
MQRVSNSGKERDRVLEVISFVLCSVHSQAPAVR